jgi:hypothetical protein
LKEDKGLVIFSFATTFIAFEFSSLSEKEGNKKIFEFSLSREGGRKKIIRVDEGKTVICLQQQCISKGFLEC